MTRQTSKLLVIDASVARACGGKDATYPTSKRCRDFLQAVLLICHQIVMSPEIFEEWKKHESNFARKWRVSMVARKKLSYHPREAVLNNQLLARVEKAARSENNRRAMVKDFRLIEAAIVTDGIVVSLDDAVRKLFGDAAKSINELRYIVWVNPSVEKEQAIQWLENGAATETNRQLGVGMRGRV